MSVNELTYLKTNSKVEIRLKNTKKTENSDSKSAKERLLFCRCTC